MRSSRLQEFYHALSYQDDDMFHFQASSFRELRSRKVRLTELIGWRLDYSGEVRLTKLVMRRVNYLGEVCLANLVRQRVNDSYQDDDMVHIQASSFRELRSRKVRD